MKYLVPMARVKRYVVKAGREIAYHIHHPGSQCALCGMAQPARLKA